MDNYTVSKKVVQVQIMISMQPFKIKMKQISPKYLEFLRMKIRLQCIRHLLTPPIIVVDIITPCGLGGVVE